MTDKKKLDAIRAEIHRLVDIRGYDREMANDLFAFMDSLPNEPVSFWHDSSKETPIQYSNVLMIRKDENDSNYPPIAGCFHGTNSRLDGKNWGYYNGFCYNEIEPPVKWAYIDDILKFSNVERTVKNWKEEPASEELEKEIVRYIGYPQEIDEDVSTTMIRKAARHFANWQREQMMKDAVEVEVKDGTPDKPYQSPVLEIQKMMRMKGVCNIGDKVKLIIIKED